MWFSQPRTKTFLGSVVEKFCSRCNKFRRQPFNCYHLQMMKEDSNLDANHQTRANATWERLECSMKLACMYPAVGIRRPQTCPSLQSGLRVEPGSENGYGIGGRKFSTLKNKRASERILKFSHGDHEMPPSIDFDVEAKFLAIYQSLDWGARQRIGHQVIKFTSFKCTTPYP